VTHDQVEAMTLAHRMIVMNAGRAEQIGTPMQVYEDPQTQFVAGFIGSPSMNFMPGRVDGGGRIMLEHGGATSTSAAAGAQTGRGVIVGIRPEHLERSTPEMAVIQGPVEMVEQLGADMLIHVAHGPLSVLARLPHGPQPDIGTVVHFAASSSRIFLFDPTTGERLR
jgi:sn-glycerol 3-phosphate transport system ATP-binding protein